MPEEKERRGKQQTPTMNQMPQKQSPITCPEALLSPAGRGALAEEELASALHQLNTEPAFAEQQPRTVGKRSKNLKARVACRIKPLGAEQREAGTQSQKQLVSWDESSITTSRTRHTFPRPVLPAEATQQQVYETLLPDLLNGFLSGMDVNFLALGQTGAGKTHSIFGPAKSMHRAFASGDATIQSEHGILIRALTDIHERVCLINSSGEARAILSGSMVELNFDNPLDLLNEKQLCALDKENHLIGATQLAISAPRDILQLCAAVEKRTTDATLANDVSSRSHCVTTLTLTRLDKRTGTVTTSRFNVVDMMGTERSKGQNSAHDVTQNNKKNQSGVQGIYANFSVFGLIGAVREVVQAQKRSKCKVRVASNSGFGGMMALTRFLKGSLEGSALTLMLVALSQAPRNGNESCISLDYGGTVASLPANPQQQPAQCVKSLRCHAEQQCAEHHLGLENLIASRAKQGFVARTSSRAGGTGTAGKEKYEEIRRSEIRRWTELLLTLDQLTDE